MTSLRDQNEILRSYSASLWQEIRFKANSHARYPHSFGWPNATYKDTNMKMENFSDLNAALGVKYHQNL